MTESTKRPWGRHKWGHLTGNPGSDHDDDILYVVHGVNVPSGEHHPRYAEALANQELIIKAVNNHDALVAALEAVDNNRGTCPLCRLYDHANDCQLAAALEQVK